MNTTQRDIIRKHYLTNRGNPAFKPLPDEVVKRASESPNYSPRNRLVLGVWTNKAGKPVCRYYYWNLKPNDPDEGAIYSDLSGRIITREQAITLLEA